MDCQYLPLAATGHYPTLFLDYIAQKDTLTPFYNRFPTLDAFQELIGQRANFDGEKRRTLVRVLERQYAGIADKPDFSILTEPNTFVVTTGHQLNLCTGPLYVPYKFVTTVNLAKKLAEAYPDYRFVPIYWMAAEDHDFAEINHFSLFGKTYTWESEQRGAVGRMDPKEVEAVLSELPEKAPLFEEAYLQNDTLANAVRQYVNALFGKEGLVCLDPDDADLKRIFAPIMKEELLHQATGALIQGTTQELEALGYRPPVSARELNLFYLEDQLRERIVREDDTYQVLNTELQFTQAEILALVDRNPERFSPNVVLRPLYQETILPNLAYIGGPSEVPYWLQFKAAFDHFQLPFPLLVPRNFALFINDGSAKRVDKLKVLPEELFLDTVQMKRSYIERISEHSLHLSDEKQGLDDCFRDILAKAVKVDKSLEGTVLAEKAKLMKVVDNLEKRLKKAEERNHETVVNQLLALKNKLFPNGNLQERSENFLTFYLNDPQFIDKLLSVFDPLDYRMIVLTER